MTILLNGVPFEGKQAEELAGQIENLPTPRVVISTEQDDRFNITRLNAEKKLKPITTGEIAFISHDDSQVRGSFTLENYQCLDIVVRDKMGNFANIHTNRLDEIHWQAIVDLFPRTNTEEPLQLSMEIHGNYNTLHILTDGKTNTQKLNK